MLHREMLINGVFVGGPCDSSVGKQLIRDPWDQTVVGAAAEGGWNEARAAIESASDAQPGWEKTPMAERTAILAKVADTIRQDRIALAELMAREIGKPITLALGEVDRTAITFELASKLTAETENFDLSFDARGKHYSGSASRRAAGVVLAITPYNWPLNLTAHKLAPALAAGCSVVVKTSPFSPLCTLGLVKLVHSCGLPDGVLNAVNCDNCAAQAMVEHPLVDMVSFTGSDKVGWMLKGLVPQKRFTLELGGNAFAYVDSTADLDWAAETLCRSAFAYAGQVCISLQHVLVAESVYDDFKDRFLAIAGAVKVDDPKLDSTLCGPVINAEHAQRVVDAWRDCRFSHVVLGGNAEANRVEPTVIEVANFAAAQASGARIATEEAFGPVVTISPVAGHGAAIDCINRSKYGIHASVFSSDDALANDFAARLRIGGIIHNDSPSIRFDSMPYGGEKQSGFGREGVRYAYEEFTWPQTRLTKQAE